MEKRIISREEFIELVNKPIEIKSETLGNLNFRHILDDDFLFIDKCLKEEIDSEILCKQFLINQMIDSEIMFDDLNKVDDEEIYLILKKYIKVENISEYFDFNSTKDIYTIFKNGMTHYRDYVNSSIVNHQLSLMKSASDIINSFNFHESLSSYLNIANEVSIAAMSQSSKIMDAMNQIKMPDISSQISNMINFSAMQSAINVQEIVKQQTRIWQNWMSVSDTFLQISEELNSFWDRFQKDYHISSLAAQKCLKKYHWFISPNMDTYIVYEIMEVCNSSSKHKLKEINNILINYFLDNDCEQLDMMVEHWSSNPLFTRRIKIIKDCINLIKNNENNINYSNLIVPTLISQIDGVQKEFMKMNGLTVNYNKICDLEGKILTDEYGKHVDPKTYFRQLTADNEFFDAMNDVFLDVLLQETHPGEEYLSIHFSRHKILHGENTNYGRKDYMIRCFMILDFLSELIFIKEYTSFNNN